MSERRVSFKELMSKLWLQDVSQKVKQTGHSPPTRLRTQKHGFAE